MALTKSRFARRSGSPRLVGQALHHTGVDGDAVDVDCPVQVRRGGDAAVAGEADGRAALDPLAFLHVDPAEVEEHAEHALAVVEDERVAGEDLGSARNTRPAAGAWTNVPRGATESKARW